MYEREVFMIILGLAPILLGLYYGYRQGYFWFLTRRNKDEYVFRNIMVHTMDGRLFIYARAHRRKNKRFIILGTYLIDSIVAGRYWEESLQYITCSLPLIKKPKEDEFLDLWRAI